MRRSEAHRGRALPGGGEERFGRQRRDQGRVVGGRGPVGDERFARRRHLPEGERQREIVAAEDDAGGGVRVHPRGLDRSSRREVEGGGEALREAVDLRRRERFPDDFDPVRAAGAGQDRRRERPAEKPGPGRRGEGGQRAGVVEAEAAEIGQQRGLGHRDHRDREAGVLRPGDQLGEQRAPRLRLVPRQMEEDAALAARPQPERGVVEYCLRVGQAEGFGGGGGGSADGGSAGGGAAGGGAASSSGGIRMPRTR